MHILTIIPPRIPSYFNAGHHLPVFQVATFLRKHLPGRVKALDCAVLNTNWKNVCELLVNNDFDLIAVMNDFDGIDTFERFVHYCRKLAPKSKLITFGRLSKQNPHVFERYGFDAIHYSGDYESGVLDYVRSCADAEIVASGFLTLQNGSYRDTGRGRQIDPDEWSFPDVEEIPYPQYDRMYLDDFNKFCGVPKRRELVVPIARGCSVGCAYCDVPAMQGSKERRVAVDLTLDYIENTFAKYPFEYVTFYAPSFTLNKKWVLEMCQKMGQRRMAVPWKCVTTVSFLNEGMIRAMAEAKCFRISVGVETIEADVAASNLPKVKVDAFCKLDEIAKLCGEYGIELNCFIIMGLPGDSISGLERTIDYIHGNDARIRPTIYTPYHEIHDAMDSSDVGLYNRQLFANRKYGDEQELRYYRLFHGYEYRKDTKVDENILESSTRELARHDPLTV